MSKKLEANSILFHGIIIHYGIGGLHACIKPGIYSTTETEEVLDIDVAGYYPNIVYKHGIKEKIYPHHLGELFVSIVGDIINERAKYPKGSAINNGLKLAGNGGVFGASKDKFTPIYDIQYFLKIVVTGQLMILRLVEDICTQMQCKIIQINTDGITLIIPKVLKQQCLDICHLWEQWSLMQLEYVVYKTMWIRDVNNYIALSDKNKTKYKGCYEIDKELHKNNSMKVIRIAVADYFIKNIPIQETIQNHTNILDFCKRLKASSGWKVEYHYVEEFEKKIQYLSKNVRYFVSKGNGSLYKRKLSTIQEKKEDDINDLIQQGVLFNYEDEIRTKEQFIGVEAGQSVTIFNKRYDIPIKEYRIDYQYYIREANKLIQDIENKQMTLL